MEPARSCGRCGRPACRRCDGVSEALCGQCVNVFQRAAAVDPRDRARKEGHVRRHARWREVSVRVLAVLGGGIGLGLKRNVLDLYKFACRNYVPASPAREGDGLYAFAFSRGAFTIRVLASLIADQGLVTGVRGRELERQARWAYRAYRRKFANSSNSD